MTKKKKNKLLRAPLLCALILGGNAMLSGAVADATNYDPGDYNEDITLTDTIGVASGTVNINGNLKVTAPSWIPSALYVYGTSGGYTHFTGQYEQKQDSSN